MTDGLVGMIEIGDEIPEEKRRDGYEEMRKGEMRLEGKK